MPIATGSNDPSGSPRAGLSGWDGVPRDLAGRGFLVCPLDPGYRRYAPHPGLSCCRPLGGSPGLSCCRPLGGSPELSSCRLLGGGRHDALAQKPKSLIATGRGADSFRFLSMQLRVESLMRRQIPLIATRLQLKLSTNFTKEPFILKAVHR